MKKLVLANNQRREFVDFHAQIQQVEALYDYSGYTPLLFLFDTSGEAPVLTFTNVDTDVQAGDYDGVYLNGYLSTVELAVTAAQVLDAQHIAYVNRELGASPSLTKLSAYAKLARAGVSIPKTYGGSAYALRTGLTAAKIALDVPFILKRADADRGVDNYKIDSVAQALELLKEQPERSVWVAQEFVPNDGFYLVSVYHDVPEFVIYRAMGERIDGRADKAHMFKPRGGANATLYEPNEVPAQIIASARDAAAALNRQIASVDVLYDETTKQSYVLEVNYNPQLVTISTFKEVREEAFLRAIKQIGESPASDSKQIDN